MLIQKDKKRPRHQVIIDLLLVNYLKITSRCNYGETLWIFEFKFGITSITKRMHKKI